MQTTVHKFKCIRSFYEGVRPFTVILLVTGLFLSCVTRIEGQTPPGYYDPAAGLTGEPLKEALHGIIDGHTEYSYSQVKTLLMDTDEDPSDPDNVILLYTGRSQPKSTFGGGPNDWNREHVWAKSHGGFGDTPPCGTDIHHMRPADASVNSDRGNKDFDNGGQPHPEATGCFFDDDSWEPRDAVKGDVARMILYMTVRYEGTNGEPDLEPADAVNTAPAPLHGKLSTLLIWNVQDPPDNFENARHEKIFGYQHNRNPFIDHPEFADMIWGNATTAGEHLSPGQNLLFPNPFRDHLTLRHNPDSGCCGIVITDASGIVRSIISSWTSTTYIDTGDWPPGVYIIRATSPGKCIIIKAVK
ncbi:MAG: endonuclease [Bacteroidales bacterium]|nr:endonuclease [Bacteroidales bacterium]